MCSNCAILVFFFIDWLPYALYIEECRDWAANLGPINNGPGQPAAAVEAVVKEEEVFVALLLVHKWSRSSGNRRRQKNPKSPDSQ